MDSRKIYEDGKYVMQDVGNLYVGSKYRLEEILEDEEIPFKFRMLVNRYLLPEADPQDTLETHLYYLDKSSFLVKIYRQLKGKVKINCLEQRKKLGGKGEVTEYVTKTLSVEELAAIPPAEKEKRGIVVQELSVSKFALFAI